MCRAVGFWLEKKPERYIEDTDRFPGWKGELPVPIQDFKNASDAGAAPASLTIGVGANGKVHSSLICPYTKAAGHARPCLAALMLSSCQSPVHAQRASLRPSGHLLCSGTLGWGLLHH